MSTRWALPERIEVIEPLTLLALLDEGRLKFLQTDVQLAYHDACRRAASMGAGVRRGGCWPR
jgi:hypothetical protein